MTASLAFAQCEVTIDGNCRLDVDILKHVGIPAPALSELGAATSYFDTALGKLQCSEDGGAYGDCVGGAGGGWTAGSNTTSTTLDVSATGSGTFGGVGETNFNVSGNANNDFRIEGDTDEDLFFVDASAEAVGVNTITPKAKFDVYGQITISDPNACIMFRDTDDGGWTKCTALNGVLTCAIDADGVC